MHVVLACVCLGLLVSECCFDSSSKNQWWWNPSTMHLFIQRKDCFLSELRKRNTFIATCINPLSNYKMRRICCAITLLPLLIFFIGFISCLSDPLNFSKFVLVSVFAFFCCGVFSCFAGHSAEVSMLNTPKSSTTSWKQQVVRMTSSCHKVFYVSLWVLTLSMLFSTTASQHSLFCDIMFKQKKSERARERQKKMKELMFDDL